MKKPIKIAYCRPFSLDNKLVLFNSKQYAKDAEKYIDHIEKLNELLIEALQNYVDSMLSSDKDGQEKWYNKYKDDRVADQVLLKAIEVIKNATGEKEQVG